MFLYFYRIFVVASLLIHFGLPHRSAHRMALLIMAASVWFLCLSVAMATAKASQNPTPSPPLLRPLAHPLAVRPALGKAVSNATQCNFINATTNDPQAGHDDDDDAPN